MQQDAQFIFTARSSVGSLVAIRRSSYTCFPAPDAPAPFDYEHHGYTIHVDHADPEAAGAAGERRRMTDKQINLKLPDALVARLQDSRPRATV